MKALDMHGDHFSGLEGTRVLKPFNPARLIREGQVITGMDPGNYSLLLSGVGKVTELSFKDGETEKRDITPPGSGFGRFTDPKFMPVIAPEVSWREDLLGKVARFPLVGKHIARIIAFKTPFIENLDKDYLKRSGGSFTDTPYK